MHPKFGVYFLKVSTLNFNGNNSHNIPNGAVKWVVLPFVCSKDACDDDFHNNPPNYKPFTAFLYALAPSESFYIIEPFPL